MRIPTIVEGIDLLRERRSEILASWFESVRLLPSAAGLDVPAVRDHVPVLLDEMVAAMEALGIAEPASGMTAPDIHGRQRFGAGFDLIEVVAEINLLRESIRTTFERYGYALAGEVAHVVHQLLDTAIGGALLSYKALQDTDMARRRHEYLSFLAHDLRSPLSVINTAAVLLRAPPADDPQMAEELARLVRENVERIDALVSSVLEEGAHLVAREGVMVQAEPVLLGPLVQGLLDSMALVARQAQVDFGNRVDPGLVMHADPKLLTRTLQNLLVNALRHAPGGPVVVEARALPEGVACAVVDSGPGIEADRLERIFDKGERGADSDGLGYGLAIARNYVRAHGGELTAASRPGQGSAFEFWLPHAAQDEAAATR